MDGNDARPPPGTAAHILRGREAALRCYAPSTSAIVALLFVGYLSLRHVTNHVLASASIATIVVIALGMAGIAAGAIAVSAATIRRRRAAAGACNTCSHPCQEAPGLSAPQWPHRPLTREALPVIIIPRQSPPAEAERTGTVQPARVRETAAR